MLLIASQSAQAIKIERIETPAGYNCYDKREMNDLADFVKKCEVCERNLKTMDEQYTACKSLNPETDYTELKVIIGVLVGLTIGFAAGSVR